MTLRMTPASGSTAKVRASASCGAGATPAFSRLG